MYTIAVCDDERESLDIVSALTESVLQELNVRYTLQKFDSQQALLEKIENGEAYHLLILDILLEDGNGVDLAKALREQKISSSVIFVSASADYALEGYDVQAIKYLLKPVNQEQLKDAIRYDYNHYFSNRRLCYWKNSEMFTVKQSELLYMECRRRQAYLHLADGRCENVRAKLSDLEEELPDEQFVRCHVSFCVNLEYVSKCSCSQVELTNGESIPVGRTYYKSFQQKMLRYFS